MLCAVKNDLLTRTEKWKEWIELLCLQLSPSVCTIIPHTRWKSSSLYSCTAVALRMLRFSAKGALNLSELEREAGRFLSFIVTAIRAQILTALCEIKFLIRIRTNSHWCQEHILSLNMGRWCDSNETPFKRPTPSLQHEIENWTGYRAVAPPVETWGPKPWIAIGDLMFALTGQGYDCTRK